MYLAHFGLSEFPFSLTPDTQFYCQLPSHTEALNVLLIALHNGEGFIKITGAVGTGKSLLCRKLLNELNSPYLTAYIPNPHLTPDDLRIAVADEFGIAFSRDTGQRKILQEINQFLLTAATNQQKPVLIIDEAQAMPLETLEELRLLTNLETEKQKLLQIVLFGQVELDEILQKKSIRQLRQRIGFSYALKKLSRLDVITYVQHRLSVAQLKINKLFSPIAYIALHFYSRGIPRLINILSHKALLSAYGSGKHKIGFKQVQLAALDTDDVRERYQPFKCRKSFLFFLALSLCLLFLDTRIL